MVALGSSPLARGLRGRYEISPCYRRIIPARAGFTVDAQPRERGLGDHPRSRGVYGDSVATNGPR